MNASDQRRKSDIEAVALSGSISNTFGDDGTYLDSGSRGRTLIVLDEADSFAGNSDRGGGSAVTEVINSTKQPLIIIANDYYELTRKSSAAKKRSSLTTGRATARDRTATTTFPPTMRSSPPLPRRGRPITAMPALSPTRFSAA